MKSLWFDRLVRRDVFNIGLIEIFRSSVLFQESLDLRFRLGSSQSVSSLFTNA